MSVLRHFGMQKLKQNVTSEIFQFALVIDPFVNKMVKYLYLKLLFRVDFNCTLLPRINKELLL